MRKFHGCHPLKLSESLGARAQSWAEHLTDSDSYRHSVDRRRVGVGENLAFRWYTSGGKRPKGDEIADVWYNEVKDYSWEIPEINLTRFAGHFTQLIWAGTTQVGFGVAADGKGKVTVVAQYQTAGNVIGEYELNVPPRIDGLPVAWPESGAATTVPKGHRSILIDPGCVIDVDTLPSDEVAEQDSVGHEKSDPTSNEETSGNCTEEGNSIIDEDDIKLDEADLKTEAKIHIEKARLPRQRSIVLSKDSHRCTLDNLNLYSIKSETARHEEITDFYKGELKYGQPQKSFIEEMLHAHNKLRGECENIQPLLLSPELCRVAQEHAEKLSKRDLQIRMSHSDNFDFGENIAFLENEDDKTGIHDNVASDICSQWYSKHESPNEEAYPATQITWKTTKLVGVGLDTSDGGKTYHVVCNYYPPGNVYDAVEKEELGVDTDAFNRNSSERNSRNAQKSRVNKNNNNNDSANAKKSKKKKKRGCLGIC